MRDRESSDKCVIEDTPFGSLLVHDPVAALPAPDGVTRSDLVLMVTL